MSKKNLIFLAILILVVGTLSGLSIVGINIATKVVRQQLNPQLLNKMRWDLLSFPNLGLIEQTALIYNPYNNKLYTYGGWGNISGKVNSMSNTMGIYDIQRGVWTAKTGENFPYLIGHSMIFNPQDKKIYIYGSNQEVYSYDTISDTLVKIEPTDGIKPPSRNLSPLAFDVNSQKFYIYGGGYPNPLSDFWSFDIRAKRWQQLPTNPSMPGRGWHAAAFDSTHKRVYIFGGINGFNCRELCVPQTLDDLWYFDVTSQQWMKVNKDDNQFWPEARFITNAFYNSATQKFTVVGGFNWDLNGNYFYNDIWEYDTNAEITANGKNSASKNSASWQKIETTGNKPKGTARKYAVAWDDIHKNLYIYGGDAKTGRGGPISYVMNLRLLNYPQKNWKQISFKTDFVNESKYPYRYTCGVRGAWSPERQEMYIFGEEMCNAGNNLWIYEAGKNYLYKPAVSGDIPTPRKWPGIAWSSFDKKLYLLSGAIYGQEDIQFYSFNPATLQWNHITNSTGNLPSNLNGPTMVFNPVDNKLYVFGGTSLNTNIYTYDIYTNHWETIPAPQVSPHWRIYHTAVWDTLRNKMIIYGGTYLDNIPPYWHPLGDIWEYTPETNQWTEIHPSGDLPPPSAYHAAVWDNSTNTMIIAGNALIDAYRYYPSLNGSPRWQKIPLASQFNATTNNGLFDPVAAWDSLNKRMIFFGNTINSQERDFWSLGPTTCASKICRNEEKINTGTDEIE